MTMRWRLGALAAIGLVAAAAAAQEEPTGTESDVGPRGTSAGRTPAPPIAASTTVRPTGVGGGSYTNSILITGYWPPTNEMIRRFSANAARNPQGWIGENWEGRGYNIYAYFPEFPNGLGRGEGDFEVDYQDTSGDWWPLVAALRPVAIVTFSRANTSNGWELEGGNRTYVASQWTVDYLDPTRPTPELPIMIEEPPLTTRMSSLPMQEIVDAVRSQVTGVSPFISPLDEGRFLSNFIGYHGCWYRVLHRAVGDPAWLICSGHIHVGMDTDLTSAITATEATLRALTTYLDKRRLPGDMNCDGLRNGDDLQLFVFALLNAPGYVGAYPQCVIKNGDFDGDEVVTGNDIDLFTAALLAD